jgi:hypothetical protein
MIGPFRLEAGRVPWMPPFFVQEHYAKQQQSISCRPDQR